MKEMYELNLNVRGATCLDDERVYRIDDNGHIGYIKVADYIRSSTNALADLAERHIVIVGPRRTVLAKKIAAISEFPREPLINRVGWNGPYFAYPDLTVFAPEGAPPAETIFEPRRDQCRQAGTRLRWIMEVARPVAGHALAEFAMCIPFAAPLLRLTSRAGNFGWEFAGPSEKGKSTMLDLMSSACGGINHGDDGEYGLTFATTTAGIETRMPEFCDLLMPIDDGTLFELHKSDRERARSLSLLYMQLGNGRLKARWKDKSVYSHRLLYATSTNETHNSLGAGSAKADTLTAVSQRLMSIDISNREFGMFDYVPSGYSSLADFALSLRRSAARVHGVAMRHYLAKLVHDVAIGRTPFQERIEKHLKRFRRLVGHDIAAGESRRVVDAFGIVYAAGLYAQHVRALPRSYDPAESVKLAYFAHRSTVNPFFAAENQVLNILGLKPNQRVEAERLS